MRVQGKSAHSCSCRCHKKLRNSSASSSPDYLTSSDRPSVGCSEVTVAAEQYSADGKRLRNKNLVCFVCQAEVMWLSRRLECQHGDNFLVAQVLSASGRRRKNGLKRLKNLGNFKHNIDVFKKHSGQLIALSLEDQKSTMSPVNTHSAMVSTTSMSCGVMLVRVTPSPQATITKIQGML